VATPKFTDNQQAILNELAGQIACTLRNQTVQTTMEFAEVQAEDAAALRGLKQRGFITYRRVRNGNSPAWGYGGYDYVDIRFSGKGWTEIGLERVFRAHQQVNTDAITKLHTFAEGVMNQRWTHNAQIATKNYESLLPIIKQQQVALGNLKAELEKLETRIHKLKEAKPTKEFQAKVVAAMMGV
jgi:hypothetical protein